MTGKAPQTIAELQEMVVKFRDARDWKQFHNAKDMALSLVLEALATAGLLRKVVLAQDAHKLHLGPLERVNAVDGASFVRKGLQVVNVRDPRVCLELRHRADPLLDLRPTQ